jgi:hypothetical protein
MTIELRKNRYASRRGPEETTVRARVPKALKTELLALSIALEEPMDSIVRRVVEEYVDAHREEVARGMGRICRECRPEGWDEVRSRRPARRAISRERDVRASEPLER